VIAISERHDDLREIHRQCVQEISAKGYSYEVIFVLDGPDREILLKLKDLKENYPKIKVITLNRRLGETTALSVGFDEARALDFPVPFHTFSVIIPLSMFIMMITLSINTVGILENAFVFISNSVFRTRGLCLASLRDCDF